MLLVRKPIASSEWYNVNILFCKQLYAFIRMSERILSMHFARIGKVFDSCETYLPKCCFILRSLREHQMLFIYLIYSKYIHSYGNQKSRVRHQVYQPYACPKTKFLSHIDGHVCHLLITHLYSYHRVFTFRSERYFPGRFLCDSRDFRF